MLVSSEAMVCPDLEPSMAQSPVGHLSIDVVVVIH